MLGRGIMANEALCSHCEDYEEVFELDGYVSEES
jgi:hypothetical protein